MAGSVNKVILVGRLGKDPEIRSLQDGKKIANFTLATSESWHDRASGERKEKTEWHRVSVMSDRTAEAVERFLKKGSMVYVEGKLETRKWTDQQGVEKYTTEIVVGAFNGGVTFLSSSDSGGSSDNGSQSSGSGSSRARGGGKVHGPGGDLDDDIPFGPEWR